MSGAVFHRSRIRTPLALVLALCALAKPAAGQVTGTPAFHAPYRSFARQEFGGAASFLENSQTAFEAFYRRGLGPADIGARLGLVVRRNASDAVVTGLDVRVPVLFHQHGSPLDGALVTGVGVSFNDGTNVLVPVGLAVGRRLNMEGSDVSLVPYVAPTGFTWAGGGNVDFGFGLGLGLDLRLSRVFEVRVSGGFGTTYAPEGMSVAAVWLR